MTWDATTLATAIDGLRDRWDEQRPVPIRVHVAEVQPADLLGSPKFSPSFWAYLSGGSYAWHWVDTTTTCRDVTPDCFLCQGQGFYTFPRRAWNYPLGMALEKLAHDRAPVAVTWPAPAALIMLLAWSNWDVTAGAERAGHRILSPDHRLTVEAAFISAIRQLAALYSPWAPDKRRIEKSEAQISAEDAA